MTNYFEVLFIGLVLSADSFSAAVAMGTKPHSRIDGVKFAFASGGAEALVAFLGAIAGTHVVAKFDSIDHWISFVLLVAVALHMGYEGFQEYRNLKQKAALKGENEAVKEELKSFHSLLRILIVSFATSLDAFAVGVSLGAANKSLGLYIVSIGAWAFISTLIGLKIAKTISAKAGPVFSLVGSMVLVALAFKFLLSH